MKICILIFGLIISASLNSQSVNVMLLDNIEERVAYLTTRLELSEAESFRMTDILYTSSHQLASIDVFSDQPETVYNNIISDRDRAIRSAIGENKFKVFTLFEKIEKEDLLKEHQMLINLSIPSRSEINESIISYRLKYVLPKVSKVNQNFVRSLSLERVVELKELKSLFYKYSVEGESDLKSFDQYLGPVDKKKLIKLLNIFKQRIEGYEANIDRWRAKWGKDQDQLAYEIVARLNISDKQKETLSKGQFKLKEDLFLLHVVMVEPNDKELYLRNLDTVFNNQIKFENLIN